jgi:hypothetical protein
MVMINGGDKIKLYDALTNTIQHEFKDSVTNLKYNSCCFSGRYVISNENWDSEYVITCVLDNISIYDVSVLNNCSFVCNLNSKEKSTFIEWHPYKPMLVSITNYDNIFIWSKNYIGKF